MTPEAMNKLCRAVAVLSVVVGGAGSVMCLPFACSTDWNIAGATGIYFVAGAVMITGGLCAYALLARDQK